MKPREFGSVEELNAYFIANFNPLYRMESEGDPKTNFLPKEIFEIKETSTYVVAKCKVCKNF